MLIGISLFLSEIIAYSLKRVHKNWVKGKKKNCSAHFMLTENYLSESFRMGNASYASTSLAFINIDNNPRKYLI